MLDSAINEVSDPSESPCELLREHLESARNYALGSMAAEYRVTLGLARQAINCITDRERRERVENMIKRLQSDQSQMDHGQTGQR